VPPCGDGPGRSGRRQIVLYQFVRTRGHDVFYTRPWLLEPLWNRTGSTAARDTATKATTRGPRERDAGDGRRRSGAWGSARNRREADGRDVATRVSFSSTHATCGPTARTGALNPSAAHLMGTEGLLIDGTRLYQALAEASSKISDYEESRLCQQRELHRRKLDCVRPPRCSTPRTHH
jgi:hypothetical protein